MSIASDIRSYADTAVTQGKQVLDQSIATAQTQLNEVGGQAGDIVGKYTATARENVSDIAEKATEAVNDLRTSAEKAINLDAIKSAIEPYLAQVKGYGSSVTDRAEDLFATLKSDPRFAKLVETAESVSGVVVETVEEYVVKPVQSLTGIGVKPAPKPAPRASKPSPVKAAKPATTKPATKPVTRPATKPATKTTARKAPAKRTPKA